jgi:glycosyltransferase involved in cell wall biosynthesis
MTGTRRPTMIVFGDDWGRHVSSMQHLMVRLVDRVDVIWINAIGHREPRLSFGDLERAVRKVRAMMTGGAPTDPRSRAVTVQPRRLIAPRVLPWHRNPVVSRFNRWSLLRDIRHALAACPPRGPVVLVTGSPPSASVVGECGEDASIYFCMDDFLHLPGTSPRMLAPLEQALLARVDAIVATARRLLETKRPRSGRSFYLLQGVNYEHFASARPCPSELRDLPRPIIGFAGGISAALHAPTIRALANAYPGGSIVLVGPLTAPSEELHAPNVHLLGARSYADLPAYVQAFDVGIIPYVENEWTRAVDPLKLLEYLAAGIPAVASNLPEVDKYSSVVSVAPLGEPFVRAVAAALTAARGVAAGRAEGVEAGRVVAAANTWQHRADRFLEIVDDVLGETGSVRSRVARHPARSERTLAAAGLVDEGAPA